MSTIYSSPAMAAAPEARARAEAAVLSVRISAGYPAKPDVLRGAAFEIHAGEILALVGESGAGKSTIALAILRLLNFKGGKVSGAIHFQGRDLASIPEREMRRVRGRQIALVPQSPIASLNPSLRIGTQLAEAWKAHVSSPVPKDYLREILASVKLPSSNTFLRLYPRELSVGLAQRLLIGMALLHRPPLIIADEPTSSLDMITQREILDLFARLNRELGVAILYISHDLLSVAAISHRMAILKQGTIVETGSTGEIFENPRHPYTRQLISSIPRHPSLPASA